MYDYYLGGKDNYPADREAAEAAMTANPNARATARANRAFMTRAARYLAESGVRQFLDIGTGLPTSPNLHETVQAVDPRARIVYVDNDPIVLVHAQALLTSHPEGMTAYVNADLRDPARILEADGLHRALDLNQPVAVSLIAILHFVPDDDEALHIVRTLLDPLPSGSCLSISHAAGDLDPAMDIVAAGYRDRGLPMVTRDRRRFAALFAGLDLLEPGVVPFDRWRPDQPLTDDDAVAGGYGAVARKS